jgi:hypothetical protein
MPNRLSARPLLNWQNVNSFKYGNQWTISAGNPDTLYFQVTDLDQCGLRYLAGIGTSNMPVQMQVGFASIDCNQAFTLIAQQDPNDGSIWSVSIPSTNTPQTGNVNFRLFEGNSWKTFAVIQMLVVGYPENNGGDGTLPDSTFFF